jgi:hypothetical protein
MEIFDSFIKPDVRLYVCTQAEAMVMSPSINDISRLYNCYCRTMADPISQAVKYLVEIILNQCLSLPQCNFTVVAYFGKGMMGLIISSSSVPRKARQAVGPDCICSH